MPEKKNEPQPAAIESKKNEAAAAEPAKIVKEAVNITLNWSFVQYERNTDGGYTLVTYHRGDGDSHDWDQRITDADGHGDRIKWPATEQVPDIQPFIEPGT